MAINLQLPDGMVRVVEHIEYYRYVPQKIYEITQALYMMNAEEQIKVMRYITRITSKRITFQALSRCQSNKRVFKAMAEMDKKLQQFSR